MRAANTVLKMLWNSGILTKKEKNSKIIFQCLRYRQKYKHKTEMQQILAIFYKMKPTNYARVHGYFSTKPIMWFEGNKQSRMYFWIPFWCHKLNYFWMKNQSIIS